MEQKDNDKDKLQRAKNLYLDGHVSGAFEIFMCLAKKGVGEAMYFVGEVFAGGYGHTVQNLEEAKKWREKGREAGSLLAALNTAYSYKDNSKKLKEICTKYFPAVLKKAQEGDVFAQNEVADLYLYGNGTGQDTDLALYWLKESAHQGFWRPMVKLGDLYHVNWAEGPSHESVMWYKKAAALRCKEALTSLGFLYFNGDEVKQNFEKSFAYFAKAAKGGDDDAYFMLGRQYENGLGCEMDQMKAFHCFMTAAGNGNPAGMWALGQMYENSDAVDPDLELAFRLFERAAKGGLETAFFSLGDCYRYGFGTEKDLRKAVCCYKKAYKGGEPKAAEMIGSLYLSGKEIMFNGEEAFRWFYRAAVHGDEDCYFELGLCYAEGIGTRPNRDRAVGFLTRAALNGDRDAIAYLRDKMNIRVS